MKTIVIWTLGVAAVSTLAAFLFVATPRLQRLQSQEYDWTSLNATSNMAGTIIQMKNDGWRVDDCSADSCGNVYLTLKRPKR